MIKRFGILVVAVGMVLAGRGAVAVTCEPGYGITQNGTCSMCPPGLVSDGTGPCDTCCDSEYVPESGSSTCTPIPAGYYSLVSTPFWNNSTYMCDPAVWRIPEPPLVVMLSNAESAVAPMANDSCYHCPHSDIKECDRGSYCPGGASDPINCPNGTTTSGTGAKSASECNVCSAGYGYYNGQCTPCPAGTYKSSSGASACSNCTNKPANSSYVGTGDTANACPFTCNDGYYGATNATSGSCTVCGYGYYCAGGVRNACGANMTTATNKATSASACVCADGYEMVDGACVELPKQTPCNAGVSVLHAGDYTYSLWTECDSPALWIGTDNGNCCVNLTPGQVNGAVNIDYLGTIYHAVN